jgi:hypothetical protein
MMALVPVRVSPAESAGERCVFPRDRISRQADHRFAGLVPVTFIRGAAPGRTVRVVHPSAAAPRCPRGPLTDLLPTCGRPGMYLAPMLAGDQISRPLAFTANGWRCGEPGPGQGSRAATRFSCSEEWKCLAELIDNAFDDFNKIMIFII